MANPSGGDPKVGADRDRGGAKADPPSADPSPPSSAAPPPESSPPVPNPPPPPPRSSWTVRSAPQDASLLPTIGVTLWLGWNGALVYLALYAAFFASNYARAALAGLCTLSLALPLDFWTAPGSPGRAAGDWCMRMGERYFGLVTVVEDEAALLSVPPDRAAVFAFEPHDVLPYPVFAFNPALGRLPGRVGEVQRCLMSSAIFRAPFLRQAYAWTCGGPVDRGNFRRRLNRGESFTFIPGGIQEVTAMDPKCPNRDVVLYLRRRKGFVKLALVEGSSIIPVFCFGVEGSYGHWIPRGRIASALGRRLGFLPMIYWGRYGVPFGIPRPRPIRVAVGRPIDLPRLGEGNVGDGDVERYHAAFLREMEALYERHKGDAVGYGDRRLRII